MAAMGANVLLGLLLFGVALAPPLDRLLFHRAPRIILAVAAVCTVVLAGQSTATLYQLAGQLAKLPGHTQFGNDAVAMTSCATAQFVAGHNPYTAVDIYRCFWQRGYYRHGSLLTPLQQGNFLHLSAYPSRALLDGELLRLGLHQIARPAEFESRFSYPAGAFVFPALAWRLGITDLRLFGVLCFVGVYLFLLWRTPRRLWPWIALLGYTNTTVWAMATSGASDALYTLLVLVGWSLRRQRIASAVAMGLAAAARQQSWFFLLFYAVLVAREEGAGELWRRGRIVAVIFLLTNLPFFVLSPGDWVRGVLGPMADPMFPRGVGMISFFLGATNVLPLAPRWFYGVLELAVFCACLVFYTARVCRRWPHLGLVLAVLPLFVAWRSLSSYFYPVSLLALGGVVDLARHHPALRPWPRAIRRPTRQMAVRTRAVSSGHAPLRPLWVSHADRHWLSTADRPRRL